MSAEITTILLGGDVCPINSNSRPFEEGDRRAILGNLAAVFDQADLRVFNLECPLIAQPAPVQKTGPVIGAPIGCASGLSAMGIDAVGLANNHIMDHGWCGLKSTLDACAKEGISTFGAGTDLTAARIPFIGNSNGVTVAILGAAAHEFSIAGEDSPGANPLDLPRLVTDIESAATTADHVVLLLHAGLDGYPLPTPRLREVCRFLVNRGARLVVCQHSHRAGCFERYRGGLIVYGQGNLLFDWGVGVHEWWNLGFLIKIGLDRFGVHSFDLIPTRSIAPGICALRDPDAETFLGEIADRSREFSSECRTRSEYYRRNLITQSRLFRRINRFLRLDKYLLTGTHRRWLLNVMRCEQHREVLEQVLKEPDHIEPSGSLRVGDPYTGGGFDDD